MHLYVHIAKSWRIDEEEIMRLPEPMRRIKVKQYDGSVSDKGERVFQENWC